MALNEAQKRFIKDKIRRLGSIDEVRAFYSQKDPVSEYARKMAPGLLLNGKKRRSDPVKIQRPTKRNRKSIIYSENSWRRSEKAYFHSEDDSPRETIAGHGVKSLSLTTLSRIKI